MGQISLTVTNNTDSILYARGYSSSTEKDEWNMTFAAEGVASSSDLKLFGEIYAHELRPGETYTYTMTINPSGIYDTTAYTNVGFVAAICFSSLNDLPNTTYAYFSRNNLNQVSLKVRYSSNGTLSHNYVAKGGQYKSITGKNIRAINMSASQTITNVVIGNAQAVVNASSWWLNIIPATADIIMNNALVSIVFFVLLISIAFKKIMPKLFDMIEDKNEKKRRRRRNSSYDDNDDDF